MSDTYIGNDYATGLIDLDPAEKRDMVEQVVVNFNDRHGLHGWDATVEFYRGGDYLITVTHNGREATSIYDSLDLFEAFESRVDEGEFMEAVS